jgi:hypothetical protein
MLGHSQTKGRATGNPNLSLHHRATSRLYPTHTMRHPTVLDVLREPNTWRFLFLRILTPKRALLTRCRVVACDMQLTKTPEVK